MSDSNNQTATDATVIDPTVPKPATKTSYFLLMIASVVGSIILLACTPLLFSYLDIHGEQAATITQLLIEKCLTAIITTMGIFGGTRGFVTLIKTFGPIISERVLQYLLEVQRVKSQAASVPGVALSSQYLPQGTVPAAPQFVASVPVAPPRELDPTVPRNEEGGEDYERTPG